MTWEDVPGWYDWGSAYEEVVENLPGGTLVEVGAFLGRSVCHLGELVRASGKPFRVVAVDTCRGSGVENGTDHHAAAVARGGGTLAGDLHRNVIACGLADVVTLVVADSVAAAALFAPDSLDLVFLDAAHDYESVCRDVRAWLPRVRPGGVLGGDDYCPVWPGVVRAVDELLPAATPWSWDAWKYVKP